MNIAERMIGDVVVVDVSGKITLGDGGDMVLKDKMRSLIQQGKTVAMQTVIAAALGIGATILLLLTLAVVLTAFFLIVIMGATDERAPKGFAAAAIGLCLTLIHLIGIPVTNVSVNPARSTGPALFAGGWALQELWLFWVAPLVGGALGGLMYNTLFGSKGKTIDALEATPIAAKVRA